REIAAGSEVLVIFRAEDGYISPNWYPSKHETHRQVPTWNYRVVHVHGTLQVHDDPNFVRRVVGKLTKTHEARTGAERPWRMSDSTAEFLDSMVANIVGIEVVIETLVGKFKLNQNKEVRDRNGVVEALAQHGHYELSRAVGRTLDSE
ncbi:FMN-binding negative transcriptional regulator, partial [Sedimenticola sp.]|uniref:FMN-binding negative transcriptional regulator n=1 Tax=Sedimenticola sp. TaxID=1940285 RepID=UPI003D0C8FF1